jgi:hypothetical protein
MIYPYLKRVDDFLNGLPVLKNFPVLVGLIEGFVPFFVLTLLVIAFAGMK